jgi:putative ABC transport system permease protein
VADRLRAIATALDTTLRVEDVRRLDAIYNQIQTGNSLAAYGLAAVTTSVLLLSAAGLYALLSFTVNQRRREIGIRSALGAQPRRLIAGIFRRALAQVAVGTGAGALAAFLLGVVLPIEQAGGWKVPGVLPAAAIFMVVVGLLAAVGPARRGLRIEPTEALRDG